MSIKVMTYVWEHSKHKGSELLTLLAIADFAHDDGTNAYPAIASLAKKTRMTQRNVQLVLKKLEASNELCIQRNAGPNGVHIFRITLTGVKSFQGDENISGGEKFSGEKSGRGGVKNPSKTGANFSPNPSLRDPSEEEPLRDPPFPPTTQTRMATKRCPADYDPSPEMRAAVEAKFPDIDFDDALDAMRDWEFSHARSDWDAVLRTWIRNEAKRSPYQPRQNVRASPDRDTRLSDKGMQTLLASQRLMERRHARAGHRPEFPGLLGGPQRNE